MNYKIEEIEGIGPAFAEKLAAADIANTDQLLEKCCDKKGRNATAKATGLSASQLLKWANMADLMRISGIGGQLAELLEASGVDTVKELRNRVPANLAAKMAEVNAEKKLTKATLSEKSAADWVAKAKEMDPMITH